MEVIVCIKQVPDTDAIRFDPEKGVIMREGVGAVINPFDLHALEAALTLKDELGAGVTAVSMGPPQAETALRDAVALGADRGILLSDRAFAGADTLATTYTLARAIERLGTFDLIVCGRQAVDGDTAQVGPGLAQRLGIPSATNVVHMHMETPSGPLRAKRAMDKGYQLVELDLPALVTVSPSLNQPRVPSLKGKMKARRMEIPVWNAQDIGADPERIGWPGSPTRVASTHVPRFDARKEMLAGTPDEQVEALLARLKEAGVL